MAYSSRLLDALDDIVTELETITTGNGYYNSPTVIRAIRPADKIVEPPEVGIELGDEELLSQTTADDAFHSETQVYIAGTVSANAPLDADASELVEATEKLRHDIKRIIASIFYKYSTAGATWSIMKGSVFVVPVMGLDENRNKAQVWARFKIRVWSMDTTLA